VPIARDLARLGFSLMATRGTAAYLRAHGIDADIVYKINEGRPHVGDELLNKRIALVINTPLGRDSFFDDKTVRSVAMLQGVPASQRSPAPPRPSVPSKRCARKG
jgi:carbamoyl-phosphate synthase large subunit